MTEIKNLETKIKELEFQLKTLRNFVYQHHHTMDISKDEYEDKHETSKAKIWVSTPEGWKEELKDDF